MAFQYDPTKTFSELNGIKYDNAGEPIKQSVSPLSAVQTVAPGTETLSAFSTFTESGTGKFAPLGTAPLGTTPKPVPPPTPTISSATLAPAPDLSKSLVNPNPQAPYPVSGLNATPPTAPGVDDLQLTEEEKRIQQTLREQGLLQDQLTGQSAYRAQQEEAQGLPGLYKTQNDLSSRLKALQNEALAIPLQLQQDATGRGITRGGLQPIETAALRNNAIQALSTSSLLEASRGNITLAQDLADRAVAQKFDPIKEQLAAKEANLALLMKDPALSLADKNRARKQQEQIDAQKRALEKDEANEKEVKSTLNLAIKYGLTDTALMDKIGKAKTPLEAMQLASKYLQDPKAKYELEEARLNTILKQTQIDAARAKASSVGKLSAKEIAANLSKKQQAQAAVGTLDEKLGLINEALSGRGMSTRVGPIGWQRGNILNPQTAIDAFGAGDNFAATIQQLTSTETLQKLIDAKANGATFGALSGQELNLLIAAASKIGKWEIKDENGNPTGRWDASEADFRRELQKLATATQKARTKAIGDSFAPDEDDALNQIYEGGVVESIDNEAGFFNE